MCRSIKTLRRETGLASDEEIEAAALQFVRKLSGYRQPSRANAEAFDRAVQAVAGASRNMLESLAPSGSRSGRASEDEAPANARGATGASKRRR